MSGKYQKSLNREATRITRILKRHYRPEKIIAFGSTAKNQAKKWSDLDLVIIKNTKERFYDRIGSVLRLIKPREAVDLLVYTPKEYEKMTRESWFVGEEIAKKGKVIYAV